MFLLLFLSCNHNNNEKKDFIDHLNIKEAKSYNDYVNEGYSRIAVDVIVLEKKMKGFDLNIEYDDDLKTVQLKRWIFDVNNSMSLEENLTKIIDAYNLNLITPLCSIDSSYSFFNVKTKDNLVLLGKVLNDGYSKSINFIYYPPYK